MLYDALKKQEIGFDTGPKELDRSKSTLVMIHGAGGCSRNWQYQTNPLNNFLNTIAIDLPGHGKSKGPAMISIENYGHWLGHLLETHFPDPVILLGHSMGGAIVQETAIFHPGMIKGIILVATGPVLRVAPFIFEGLEERFEETIDLFPDFLFAGGADRNLTKETARMIKEQGKKTVLGDFSACHRFDRMNDISKIDTPCLIICGENDKMTPPSLSRKLEGHIGKSRLVIISSSGHMVMMEKPDEFNKHVLDFAQEGTIKSD